MQELEAFMAQLGVGRIATVIGRYYAMDRDKRWERTKLAYDAMVAGVGLPAASAEAAILRSYDEGVTDEFIKPAVVLASDGRPVATIREGDSIICFNFRADRVRQLLSVILDPPDGSGFARHRDTAIVTAVGMTEYSEDLTAFMQTIFPTPTFPNTLGEVVAAADRMQLRMAETEKYPHVTYFFNGGREEPYDGEARVLVPSPKVATYDMKPEMSAAELTDKAVIAINSGQFDLIVLNYANPDMVGHTGSLPAAIKAVETVDAELGRIAEAVEKQGGALLVTADHGNCELMRDPETGGPHTAHTTNPVPVILLGGGKGPLRNGRLADLAPTLLELMELPKPAEMTGQSLRAPAA
jgi:2,3-bisphosphoglycerate-independent phosphoglycerate mutase